MCVVPVTLFTFLLAVSVRMLDSREGTVAQQAVLTFDSIHVFVLWQLTPAIRRSEPLCPLSPTCRSKYQCVLTSHMMFRASQAIWKIPDRVLIQNIFHKNFIGTDKIR